MIPRQLARSIHTNYSLYESTKSLLYKLRKCTGYKFQDCRTALELHNNDFQKATEWLDEQAHAQGWSKAQQLETRKTTQGLICMMINNNHGTLVEINCETDFVARNKTFHNLSEIIVSAVLKRAVTFKQEAPVNKNILYTDELKTLVADDGKTLADHSALTIGSMGENIKLKRAVCISVQPGMYLYGCTHPGNTQQAPFSFGRYGTLLALKSKEKNETLGMQLCQHIIGMNPLKIGDPNNDIPADLLEDESTFLFQEFLFTPELSVQQLVTNMQVEIVDFVRYQIGENLEADHTIETVETCG